MPQPGIHDESLISRTTEIALAPASRITTQPPNNERAAHSRQQFVGSFSCHDPPDNAIRPRSHRVMECYRDPGPGLRGFRAQRSLQPNCATFGQLRMILPTHLHIWVILGIVRPEKRCSRNWSALWMATTMPGWHGFGRHVSFVLSFPWPLLCYFYQADLCLSY